MTTTAGNVNRISFDGGETYYLIEDNTARTEIGTLSNLITESKASLVDAINEVNSNIPMVATIYDSTSSDAMSGIAVASAININIGKVFKPSGSITAETLPSLSAENLGNVYNITNSFTTNENFVDGSGKEVPAGANVGIVDIGTAQNPSYKYDIFAGIYDFSGFQTLLSSSNKLNADYIENGTTNKIVTNTEWNTKQDVLSAGTNISISENVISAIDTTYTAGTGLSLSGTVFNHSNSITGATVGSISDTEGSSLEIPYITYDNQGHITETGTITHTVSGFLTEHQSLAAYTPTSELANVAITGSYDDLTDKPEIPGIPTNISAFNNDIGYLTEHQDLSEYTLTSELADVALSGEYTDLIGTPSEVSAFDNDAGYLVAEDIEGKQDIANLVTNISLSSTDIEYPSAKAVYDTIANAEYQIGIDSYDEESLVLRGNTEYHPGGGGSSVLDEIFIPKDTHFKVELDGSGDFDNLQDAVNYLNGKFSNGQIYFDLGEGTFNISTPLYLDAANYNIQAVILNGKGINNTIIKGKTVNIFNNACVYISNLTVDYNNRNEGSGIYVEQYSKLTLSNIKIKNVAYGLFGGWNSFINIQTSITFENCNTAVECQNHGFMTFEVCTITMNNVSLGFNWIRASEISIISSGYSFTSVSTKACDTRNRYTSRGICQVDTDF